MPRFANESTGFGSVPFPLKGDSLGIGDLVNLIGAQAERQFSLFRPLQDFSAETLTGIAGGDPTILNRLAAPAVSGIKAQTPQIQRQLSDTLSGGALAEATTGAITDQQGQISDILGGLQTDLLGTALNTGLNLSNQTITPLSAAGSLRVGQRSSGGKK